MKTTYRLNGKKITQKKLIELTGADRVKRLTEDAKEAYMEDPATELDYFLGHQKMLNIQFS
ncbi:MAG: hypothetical protein LUD84_10935 [Clostridiales bacterium]|nr:hypothetical protein [Clostridiales bacterium]